jgi:hypothetical protein
MTRHQAVFARHLWAMGEKRSRLRMPMARAEVRSVSWLQGKSSDPCSDGMWCWRRIRVLENTYLLAITAQKTKHNSPIFWDEFMHIS